MHVSPSEANAVIEIMSHNRDEKDETEIHKVLQLMKKHNSIQYAQQCSIKFLMEAAEKFKENFKHVSNNKAKQLFLSLIHFFVEREY